MLCRLVHTQQSKKVNWLSSEDTGLNVLQIVSRMWIVCYLCRKKYILCAVYYILFVSLSSANKQRRFCTNLFYLKHTCTIPQQQTVHVRSSSLSHMPTCRALSYKQQSTNHSCSCADWSSYLHAVRYDLITSFSLSSSDSQTTSSSSQYSCCQ